MISKIFYINDEQKNVTVRVLDSRYDPTLASGDEYVILEPAEGRIFEVHHPERHILYVKKWPGMVLISSIPLSNVQSISGHSQPCLE